MDLIIITIIKRLFSLFFINLLYFVFVLFILVYNCYSVYTLWGGIYGREEKNGYFDFYRCCRYFIDNRW